MKKEEYDKEATVVVEGDIHVVRYKVWDDGKHISVEVPQIKLFTITINKTVDEMLEFIKKSVESLRKHEREVAQERFCRRIGVNTDGVLTSGRTWFDPSPVDNRPEITEVTERLYEIWGVGMTDDGILYLRHGNHESHILVLKNGCMRAIPK